MKIGYNPIFEEEWGIYYYEVPVDISNLNVVMELCHQCSVRIFSRLYPRGVCMECGKTCPKELALAALLIPKFPAHVYESLYKNLGYEEESKL